MNNTTVAKALKAHGDAALRGARFEAYAAITGMALGLALDEFEGNTSAALHWLNKECGLTAVSAEYRETLRQCGIAEVR